MLKIVNVFDDVPMETLSKWAERIHARTGIDKGLAAEALTFYHNKSHAQQDVHIHFQ
jgi:hypothetical protein